MAFILAAMNLQSFRKQRGLSQAALARRLTDAGHKCTQSLVSQWEAGSTQITAEWCVIFERVLPGVTRLACRPDIFGAIEPLIEKQQDEAA